uniref:Uncharacterized protein n=1 Tax=Meloidogyne hapla TaxID=6305 RepID=A0A1I8BRM2_MELHA
MSKVYRSLFLIVFVNIGCYTLGFMITSIVGAFFPSNNPVNIISFGTIPGVLINIGSASNAPILYINSTDYKKAYKKEFKLIKKIILLKCFGIHQISQVHPMIPSVNNY